MTKAQRKSNIEMLRAIASGKQIKNENTYVWFQVNAQFGAKRKKSASLRCDALDKTMVDGEQFDAYIKGIGGKHIIMETASNCKPLPNDEDPRYKPRDKKRFSMKELTKRVFGKKDDAVPEIKEEPKPVEQNYEPDEMISWEEHIRMNRRIQRKLNLH